MKVWLITVGEPLPLPGNRDRMWRTGLLAQVLAGRGHDVLWWTSTVNHFTKTFAVPGEARVRSEFGVDLQFLHGPRYTRNVSVRRMLNHSAVARRFRILSKSEHRPDVLLCSFPTIELSREAVDYAMEAEIPVALDVRDLWPDIFLDQFPRWARGIGRAVLASLFRDTANAFRNANALIAISDGYLRWGLEKAGRPLGSLDRVFPLAFQPVAWSEADERALNARLGECGLQPGAPLIAFAGTFGRTYDLATVISAARRLANGVLENARFVLCGRGEHESQWKELAGGAQNVVFPGWLPAGELACLLERSVVGLAAYAARAPQSVPNKVIEYLSAGLPILCSLDGESRQLLEAHACGLYYAPGDDAALAAAVAELLESADRRQNMGIAARALFARSFSADSVYREMADHVEVVARDSLRRRMPVGPQAPS